MNTFGEKVMRFPCAASRRAAARAMRSGSGASSSAVTSTGRSTDVSTVAAMKRRLALRTKSPSGQGPGEMGDRFAAGRARTPPTFEGGVGLLAPVRDQPLAVDGRELVEVPT